MSKFTVEDAELLARAAQAAPLQNLATARELDSALGRFVQFMKDIQAAADAKAAKKAAKVKA